MPTVISTASVAQAIDETYGFDNLAPLAGTWRNISWPSNTPLVWGRQAGKFTFDFEEVVFKFSNMTPAIPADAKIVSAILRGRATQTSTPATFFTVIQVNVNDGHWNLPSASGWRTASPVGTPSEADVHVRNLGLGTIVDTAVAPTHPWAIRDNTASRYLRAGQGVEVAVAGTLGFVDITLNRLGAVGVGNVWCEVYSQDADGLADTLLATSTTRLASAVPAAAAPFRFTFPAPEQIALTLGQDIVVVLNGDYPVSATQNIAMWWTPTGGAHGAFQLDGTGIGLDDQNYPMQDSFRTIPTTAGFVVWVAPRFFVGVDYDTPSFAALLQAFLHSGSYTEGDPFAVSVARNLLFFPAGTADRRWANFAHASPSVQLIVEWTILPDRLFLLSSRGTQRHNLKAATSRRFLLPVKRIE